MERTRCKWITASLLQALAATLLVSAPAGAAEPDNPSDWDYRLAPYLWIATITGDALGQKLDVPFSTLVDDLSMGFMGDFQARRNKWTFGFDLLYMNEKFSKSAAVPVPDLGSVDVDGTGKLKAWVVTPTVGYALVDSDTTRFEVVGGLRYLDLDTKIRLDAEDQVILDDRASKSYWDGIIGARGFFELNDKWYIPVYADVGWGDSKDTWQAMAGISYRFKKGDVTLVYRYMKYTFDSDDLLDDLELKGPALGFSFYF